MSKLLIILFVLSIFSCSSINKQFINSVDSYTETILPEYKEYGKNDPALDKDSKRIRIQTANTFQALVDSAKAVVDKEKPVEDSKKVEDKKPVVDKEKPIAPVAEDKKVESEKPIENKEKPVIDSAKVESEKPIENKEKPVEEEKNNE